jgi:hypothetical protein
LQFAFEKKSIEDSAGLRDIELEKQKQRLEKALGLTDKSEEEKKAIIANSSQDVKDSFNEIAEAQKVSETRKNKELLTAKTAYQNEVSAVDKQAAKDTVQNAEDTAAALVKIDADVADARTELLIKQISDTEKFVQDLLSIYQDKADKQNEIERKRLDEEVRLTEKAADRQFERAIRGQDNIYEFQEQKAVEARNRQFKAEKDAQKREEALRLASIYFSALQVRLAEAATQANQEKDTGKKATVTTTTAPFLALKDAFLAEAIAGSLAGAFATGVENFQGKGTGTSDSNLIAFSHGESVVTAKGTAENAGLATAMNEGRVDDYFARVWLPKFDMDNSTRNITKTVKKDDTNYKLLNEIRDLKNVMASRPVQQVHVDSFGNIIETSYKNGLKTTISHQMKKPL